MAMLSEWERKFRMVGQDVFHVKKVIRDSRGKNEMVERRLHTLQEKQIELLKERIKELENELKEKGEKPMNTQKIQLEVVLSADTKEFLRGVLENVFRRSMDETTEAKEPIPEETITKEGELTTKEETEVETETMTEDAKTEEEIKEDLPEDTTETQNETAPTEPPIEDATQTPPETVPEEAKESSDLPAEGTTENENTEEGLPTKEELRAAAGEVMTKDPSKESAIVALLQEFEAAKLSDIPVMKRREFMMRLKAL